MGMPVIVEIKDSSAHENILSRVFAYFTYVDETFSTFKSTSEVSRINNRTLSLKDASKDVQDIFRLSEKTKIETNGYFNIKKEDGTYDPSGIVKGWAIHNAANILLEEGCKDFYVEAGGDIQVHGREDEGWSVGIKNPFNVNEIIKMVRLKNNEGIATSGNYERGSHIYNPKNKEDALNYIVSLTVIGPNVYEADRFATAAFVMQKEGIMFIEKLKGFEGYMINSNKIATMTSGFTKYVKRSVGNEFKSS